MASDDTRTLTTNPFSIAPNGNFQLPACLGHIRLIREAGRGGMGVVWLGYDDLLGREVAVKLLLHAERSPDDPNFARFLDGARAVAGIRHLGLTALHHADLINGVPYLVMDYVDGPTLTATCLARQEHFHPPRCLKYSVVYVMHWAPCTIAIWSIATSSPLMFSSIGRVACMYPISGWHARVPLANQDIKSD